MGDKRGIGLSTDAAYQCVRDWGLALHFKGWGRALGGIHYPDSIQMLSGQVYYSCLSIQREIISEERGESNLLP